MAANIITAVPSQTHFVINGQPVSVTAAYSINNTKNLQLRAIAAMLNGTAAQFDVGWDGQYAVIEPGKLYTGNGPQGAGKGVPETSEPSMGKAPQSGGKAPGIDIVHIPAGTFALGAKGTEVTLTKGYYIGKYEVTQEQYQAVMDVNPSYFDGSDDNWVGNVLKQMPDGSYAYVFDLVQSSDGAPKGTVLGEVQTKRPVESVSWYDALVLCNKLSILSNLLLSQREEVAPMVQKSL